MVLFWQARLTSPARLCNSDINRLDGANQTIVTGETIRWKYPQASPIRIVFKQAI
jgi:hypothetical protein